MGQKQRTDNNNFHAQWAASLLEGLQENCSEETRQACLKNCADLHYNVNQMEQQLEPYIGDIEGFIKFLTESLGWVIEVDEKRIRIDENKEYCVCPIAEATEGKVSPGLCDCSAHYAGRMFSKVLGKEVKAEVRRSYLRDGCSCIYEVSI